MKKLLFISIFLFSIGTLAQSNVDSLTILQKQIDQQNQEFRDSLQKLNKRFSTQKNEILHINQKINSFSQRLENQNSRIHQQAETIQALEVENILKEKSLDSIQAISQTNKNNIETNTKDLDTKIRETRTTARDGLAKLDKNLSKNRLYWIIATLITLLLGGLIYWLLRKRISSSKTDVETQIDQAKKSVEEESVRLDNKLIEVLETQLKINQNEKTIPKNEVGANNKIDHSLALKVADEIIRIQKNLNQMDAKTRGLKQLSASIKRIRNNFASNGYELVDMLGKEYKEGMKVIANFVPSEDLETGKQVITRIIKPQVNYKKEMIQSAQIEVSVGE